MLPGYQAHYFCVCSASVKLHEQRLQQLTCFLFFVLFTHLQAMNVLCDSLVLCGAYETALSLFLWILIAFTLITQVTMFIQQQMFDGTEVGAHLI